MPFRRGMPSGAGRPTGSLNMANKECRDLMAREGFNPIFELIVKFRDPKSSESMQMFCLKELAKRHSPELRTIDPMFITEMLGTDAAVKSIVLNFGNEKQEQEAEGENDDNSE